MIKKHFMRAHAERNVLKVLEGDCETAVGAHATIEGDEIILEAELFSLDGSERFYEKKSSKIENAKELGKEVGQILKKNQITLIKNNMHILLTRPLEDCSEMIIKFKSLGHQVSHLPLLSVDKIDHEMINFSDFKGIIFTSANAVKFLDLKSIDKNLLCFCVGSATEKKARSAGFQNVIAAEGNVENLKELILQNFDQKDGRLIYVSGEIISVDLDQQLIREGYNIKRIVNYRTTHNQKFDKRFVE